MKVIAAVPATYVLARLSLVFPATAIDGKVSLRWSWKQSRHNGWRLVVVVGALPWALSFVTSQFYREGASVLELMVLAVAGVLLFVVEIAALSLSYEELGQEPMPLSSLATDALAKRTGAE